jgi:UDP-N-acetylglucosamine--N-acetylmuramyl-(pentapeptide) pyrophosphoryl-undecaprenol N-acetylglucosamine transferase
VPVFLAARLLGIPTLIYLPDVVPGLAVQALSRVATQIACSVEDSAPFFGKWVKIVQTGAHTNMPNAEEGNGHMGSKDKRKSLLITGYPVRADLLAQDRAACRRIFGLRDDLPVVVIYGGSRGARSINRAVQTLLGALLAETQLIHICGREGDEVWLQTTAATLDDQLQARYRLYPYLESGTAQGAHTPSMVAALGAADLAVCRSGASVLGELPALGLPSILVPYPYVHQEENADYLVRNGAAVKIADGAMVGNGNPHHAPLFTAITRLVRHGTQERNAMAAQCRALARHDAAQCLAHALYNLAKRGG